MGRALVVHYEMHYPDQISDALTTKESQLAGTMNYDKKVYLDGEMQTEVENRTYKVFDYVWNREFTYTYKHPSVRISPPKIGNTLAKIFIDDSFQGLGQYDSNNNWVSNITAQYSVGIYGGCEWYADGRFWELYGIPLSHFDKFFVAGDYLVAADQYEEMLAIRNVYDVRENSIGVFQPVTANAASHVVFIEYVERDSSGRPVNVYFTEGNTTKKHGYDYGKDAVVTKLSIESFINRGSSAYMQKCIGYVLPNPEFYK